MLGNFVQAVKHCQVLTSSPSASKLPADFKRTADVLESCYEIKRKQCLKTSILRVGKHTLKQAAVL